MLITYSTSSKTEVNINYYFESSILKLVHRIAEGYGERGEEEVNEEVGEREVKRDGESETLGERYRLEVLIEARTEI